MENEQNELAKEVLELATANHMRIVEKVKSEYNIEEAQAKEALDICADFNVVDEKDLFSNYLPIVIHTLKRINEGA